MSTIDVLSPKARPRGGDNNFKCHFDGCTLSYNRQWKLDRHVCSHTGQRPFVCETSGCNKTYQSKSHLQRHSKTAHTILSDILLPCMVQSCKATFKNTSALLKHYKNHGKARILSCSICSVTVTTARRLAQHELLHSGVLPYICSICNAGWTKNTLLRRHMRSHALLQCEYQDCSEVCASRLAMRRHIHIQHCVPLTCDFCKKSFNNKGSLREHVLVHLPVDHRRAFCCPHEPCKRSYFQMRNLRHHIKVFHTGTRYYCSVAKCLSSFLSKVRLERHALRRHGIRGEKQKTELITQMTAIAPTSLTEGPHPESAEPSSQQFVMLVINRDHISL